MGYEFLLPLPDGWSDNVEEFPRSCMQKDILGALVEESKELMSDFRRRSEAEEDIVLVNLDDMH